ncbi:phosphotransferase [Anaerosporobacter faecicola]|uniref:phosphotransferase n=1 Tax=Anaerosporobacter faecicola TaxID=2718714 RepID=UPI001438F7B0|nr:phosphotransferase [Anaerosporobacter faecicola]
MNTTIQDILINWNLQGTITELQSNTWEINKQYILKSYDDEDLLKRNIQILHCLHSCNVPVPQIHILSNGNDYLSNGKEYYLLMSKLPGKRLNSINQAPAKLARQMGSAIGTLHCAFQTCEKQFTFWDNNFLNELKGWIYDSFATNNWSYLAKETYLAVVDKLATAYPTLPKQLIHRDVHFGNFLFEEESFTGYIDFDLSQRNIRIFDLAYFLLGLLSERTTNQLTDENWLIAVANTIEGYECQQPLIPIEKALLPTVMKGIELLFTAYFINEQDDVHAKDAMSLYHFICNMEADLTRLCM